MNDDELAQALYDAYSTGYDEPRPMHYTTISAEFDTDELSETDAVANAFTLGCDHANQDAKKLLKNELLDELASW